MPPEMVEEVLGHCDKPSLLVLSRVERRLNTLVLSRYFTPEIFGTTLFLPVALPMRVLRIAFWLPKTITSICYRPGPNTTYRQYINDIRHLTSFIHRMPKIVSLNIEYSSPRVDCKKHNTQTHYAVWERLVAGAISKGCKDFSAREDKVFTDSPTHSLSPKPPWWFGAPDLRSKFIGLPLKLGQASASNSSRGRLVQISTSYSKPGEYLSAESGSTLRAVQFDGSSFDGPFSALRDTVLTQHAITITRLSLGVWHSEKETNSMLESIHFPELQFFDFGLDGASPTLLLKFLHHHPHLVDLILRGNFNKDQVQQLGRPAPAHPPPKFPILQRLEMFPEVLEWLVPDFRLYTNIKRISLESNRHPEPRQDAITSVLNNLHASASMTSPVEITIWLPLRDTDWVSKLHNVANSSGPSPCWSRVKTISLWETMGALSKSTDPIPSVWIDWISRFPSLERLEVYPLARELKRELRESLAVSCPRLSSESVSLLDD